jgi:hypothetical protein
LVRFSRILICILAFSLAIASSAGAAARIRATVKSTTYRNLAAYTLVVNGKAVFTITHYQRGGAPWKVADRAVQTIVNQFEDGKRAVKVERDGHEYALSFGGRVIAIAGRAEADTWETTPKKLALSWADALREALKVPALFVTPKNVAVPLGDTRTFDVGGWASGPITAYCVHKAIADVNVSNEQISVTGNQAGEDLITIIRGENSITLTLRVLPKAVVAPPRVEAVVTGKAISGTQLRFCLGSVLRANLTFAPGADFSWAIDPNFMLPPSLPANGISIPVKIHAVAKNAMAVETVITVHVAVSPLYHGVDERLFFSNDPERFARRGLLSEGRFNTPARLIFHHQNGTRSAVRFVVALYNPTEREQDVHVVEGVGGPTSSAMQAGLAAGRSFLVNLTTNTGYVLDLAPGQATPVAVADLAPSASISGVVSFDPVDRREVAFAVYAVDPDASPHYFFSTRENGDTAYDGAYVSINEDISVSQKWHFTRFGEDVIRSVSNSNNLPGSYGVIYNIYYNLTNPQSTPQDVYMALQATAGPACGFFLIDGKWVETPLLRTHDDAVLAHFVLAPGQSRRVTVTTMPLSGSFYPANLVIRNIPE